MFWYNSCPCVILLSSTPKSFSSNLTKRSHSVTFQSWFSWPNDRYISLTFQSWFSWPNGRYISVTFQSWFSWPNGRYISVTIQSSLSAIQSAFRCVSVKFTFLFLLKNWSFLHYLLIYLIANTPKHDELMPECNNHTWFSKLYIFEQNETGKFFRLWSLC